VIRPGGVFSRPTLVCLLILTILACLGALYVGKDVILPIILALLLKLLLQRGRLPVPESSRSTRCERIDLDSLALRFDRSGRL
jgi:hypothetical protein